MEVEGYESFRPYIPVHALQPIDETYSVELVKAGDRQEQEGQATEKTASMSKKNVSQAVESMQEIVKVFNTRLSFKVDDATGKVVIKVVDNETGDVIRQIPPQEILETISKIRDVVGLLFDKEV